MPTAGFYESAFAKQQEQSRGEEKREGALLTCEITVGWDDALETRQCIFCFVSCRCKERSFRFSAFSFNVSFYLCVCKLFFSDVFVYISFSNLTGRVQKSLVKGQLVLALCNHLRNKRNLRNSFITTKGFVCSLYLHTAPYCFPKNHNSKWNQMIDAKQMWINVNRCAKPIKRSSLISQNMIWLLLQLDFSWHIKHRTVKLADQWSLQ